MRACEKLISFGQAHKALESFQLIKKYVLLVLDLEKGQSDIQIFENVTEASEKYAKIEKSISDNPAVDAVLVSAEDMSALSKAYPNYFVDTRSFVSVVNSIRSFAAPK